MTTETTPAAAAETPAPSQPPTTETTAPAAETQEHATNQQPAAETQAPGTPEPQEGKPEGQGADESTKKPNKVPFQQRISQLAAQRNEWQVRAQAAEAELRKLREPLQEPGPNASQDEVDRFNVKAAVRDARAEEVNTQREMAATQARAIRDATIQAKAEAAADRMPGLWEGLCALPELSNETAEFIAASEKGAEVGWYLKENPAEAARLNRLPPYQQGIELGRIEGRLSAPAPKQVSTAPRPAPILNGGSSPPAFDIHKASVEDVAQRLKKAGII